MDLNPAQAQAVSFKDGPCLVLAGPGSGKTSVITKRLLSLIEEHGISPMQLLTITFTKAAAVEMQSRFYKLSDSRYPEVVFGTFHSVFYQIIRQIRGLQAPVFLKPLEAYRLTEQVLKEAGLKYSTESVRSLMNAVSAFKNGFSEAPRMCGGYIDCFYDLEQRIDYLRKNLNLIGFDDIIPDCLRLFREDGEALTKWRQRFRYIQIDEFQDVNASQVEILKLLAGDKPNLFAVGDDDQAIYAFRGATPSFMLDFDKRFPGSTMIKLDINYRSTPDIVTAAGKVIALNKKRLCKEITPFRKEYECLFHFGQEPSSVEVQSFETEEEELTYLLSVLRGFISNRTGQEEQAEDTIAVLTRTNHQAGNIALLLSENKIPYFIKEKITPLADNPYVMDLCAYLRAGSCVIKREDFLRIMNKPLRFIARDAVSKEVVDRRILSGYYARTPYMLHKTDKLFRDLELIGRLSPSKAIDFIRKGIGYNRYLQAEMSSSDYQKATEILNLLQEKAGLFTDTAEFLLFLEDEKRRLIELNNRNKKRMKNNEQVRLMTMHASKGLEFHTVLIPFLNEGQLPGRRAITEEAREEERRLFYVGMTRARDRLIMTYTSNDQKRCSSFLSPLLNNSLKKPIQ